MSLPTSELAFETLCALDPSAALAALQSPDAPGYLLTYWAETASDILHPSVVVPALIGLLKHPEAIVREGALLGLQRHDDPRILAAAEALLADPSQAVRETATGLLEWSRERHVRERLDENLDAFCDTK
jgi:HEAT repeat protein